MSFPLSLVTDASRPTLVIFSQVYVPDPASVGQHMHDAACELVRRGMRVIVFTSDRGYDDPSQRFARYEVRDGVHVLRVPLSSFGKRAVPIRLLGAGIYLTEAVALALTLRRIDRVLVSTSPPMCAAAGLALQRARGVPYAFWIMDLNPDQIVALGSLSPDALLVRSMDWLNVQALRSAERVITLDRFMAERVCGKQAVEDKLDVLPPWPHTTADAPADAASGAIQQFRETHDFGDARVVMYSGNLSLVHPLATLLDAAQRFVGDPRLVFVFIGGGLGREAIERARRERAMSNVRTLPYQPLSTLPVSLGAASVHVVAMGNSMVGIVHPSKIYGAMAVARPILAFAPRRSHVAELVAAHRIGWVIPHGDVAAAARALEEIASAPQTELDAMGHRAQEVVRQHFDRRQLIERFAEAVAPSAKTPADDALRASE